MRPALPVVLILMLMKQMSITLLRKRTLPLMVVFGSLLCPLQLLKERSALQPAIDTSLSSYL